MRINQREVVIKRTVDLMDLDRDELDTILKALGEQDYRRGYGHTTSYGELLAKIQAALK